MKLKNNLIKIHIQFDYINDNGEFFINVGIDSLPELSYGCGIYKLMKI